MSSNGVEKGSVAAGPQLEKMLKLVRLAESLPKGITLAEVVEINAKIAEICQPSELPQLLRLINKVAHTTDVEPVRWGTLGIGD